MSLPLLNNSNPISFTPDYWMSLALEQAKIAESLGEVPVGAIIVKDNKLIASAYNSPIKSNDSSAHAEINVIRQAGEVLKNYRLIGCELYVTLEPCMMCLGAMIHSRISKLYYGANDPKTGVLGGQVDLTKIYNSNHNIEVYNNILSEPCSKILKKFFKSRR